RRRHTRFSRDWSSDVCSSDLKQPPGGQLSIRDPRKPFVDRRWRAALLGCGSPGGGCGTGGDQWLTDLRPPPPWSDELRCSKGRQIGRASCRERVDSSVVGEP